MREISFYLSDENIDRLYAIKQIEGRRDLAGNAFARELLERELYRLFPAVPEFDENGDLINAGK